MRTVLVPPATWLLRVLPEGVAIALAIGIADLCWLVLRKRRQTLEENLRYTAADRTRHVRRHLGRETFRNLARCTVDFLRIPWMNRADLLELVDWHGREHLDRALERGKGVLLLSGHMGNWELAGLFFAAHDYPIHTVAEDAPGDGEFRTYQRYRTATGMKVLPLGRAGRVGYRVLQRGDILALLSDRVIAGRLHAASFCGGRRPMPIGPAKLARRLGATVLICYLVLNPAGSRRYLCVIEPPVEVEPANCDDRRLTQEIADRFSRIVHAHPDQWFVFQPHWLPGET